MLTLALAVAFSLAAAAAGAEPEPAATSAASAQREPLREIGRVRARSSFCESFVTHFNGAARAMMGNDQQLGFINFTLGGLESHFKAKGGELLLYDDRVRLIHLTGDIFKAVPELQGEIDALRRGAASAGDPAQAEAARETAAALQAALDRQRAMASDSLGVVHALMDLALGQTSDLPMRSQAGGPPSIGVPETSGPSASTDYTGGNAANSDYAKSTPAERRDVRSYLQFNKQFDRIAQSESEAVAHARALADGC